jgi:hypothetical protein
MKALCRSALLASTLLAVTAAIASAAGAAPRSKPLPALTPVRPDALTQALESRQLSEAEYALERARSLFQLRGVRSKFGHVARPPGRDATLVLRDLAVRLRFLSGAERAQAERILARPDDGDVPIGNGWTAPRGSQQTQCDPNVCVHWVDRAGDPDRATTAFKDDVRTTMAEVWSQEITTIGYREPLDDSASANHGPDGRLDVYLEDLGTAGVFGYCASDDPNLANRTIFAISAYCVLDNDYSALQYGTSQQPVEFLQVTAAHEFNHASQFAYDAFEDLWLMEGTAANMEETVFPHVNDNITFLQSSQLRHPAVPLDRSGFSDTEYGAWIFWRYLEEKVYGNDPGVIRRVWERADASTPFAPDDYSLNAVRKVVWADGRRFVDVYAGFGVTNRLRDYEDRALYPSTPTRDSFRLGPAWRGTGWRTVQLNHLATVFFSFKPGPRVPARGKLRVDVDLTQFGRATLISRYTTGPAEVRSFALGAGMRGTLRVPFGHRNVRRVDLALANGSYRTACFEDLVAPPFFSCFGAPTDDRRIYGFKARIAR